MKGDDVESIVEILPEETALNPLWQLIRGYRDDASVTVGLSPTEWSVGPLSKKAKELGLSLQGKLLDVVEEERSLASQRHPAGVVSVCPTEGSSAVTEELALEERSRDRSDVNLHKSSSAGAGVMQSTRESGAAGACLAEDEQRRVRSRCSLGAAKRLSKH